VPGPPGPRRRTVRSARPVSHAAWRACTFARERAGVAWTPSLASAWSRNVFARRVPAVSCGARNVKSGWGMALPNEIKPPWKPGEPAGPIMRPPCFFLRPRDLVASFLPKQGAGSENLPALATRGGCVMADDFPGHRPESLDISRARLPRPGHPPAGPSHRSRRSPSHRSSPLISRPLHACPGVGVPAAARQPLTGRAEFNEVSLNRGAPLPGPAKTCWVRSGQGWRGWPHDHAGPPSACHSGALPAGRGAPARSARRWPRPLTAAQRPRAAPTTATTERLMLLWTRSRGRTA